jgi:orotidine-5'-phosphate decarboxylase
MADVAKYGLNNSCGLLVNSSRQIIFASAGTDFAKAARIQATKIQLEMEEILFQAELIE